MSRENQHLALRVRQAIRAAERVLQPPGREEPLLHAVRVDVRPSDEGVLIHLRFIISYGVPIPRITQMICRRIAARLAEKPGVGKIRLLIDVEDLEFPAR